MTVGPTGTGQRATASPPSRAGSPWAPFGHAVFATLWIATVVSNVGAWMASTASGWLMTRLDPSALSVSLVQVATSLPMLLFALPAGALADIVDRRRLLILVEIATTAIAAVFALLVRLDVLGPITLLALTFLAGAGAALSAPAWQAIVPQLVPRKDLNSAIAANSVGVNISRAIGPALGGLIIGWAGMAAPFWVDAVSNLAIVGALVWWRSAQKGSGHLPAERFGSAIRTGVRHARNNPPLRATLMRAVAYFLFASAYWALLPLVARNQLGGGAELYGVLLGAIGAGAVGGAFAIPKLKVLWGADRLVAAGTIGTALALLLYGLSSRPAIALAASIIAGVSWIGVLSSLNVSAQVALPGWVRGRGLALFVAIFYGAMTVGSAIWGEFGGWLGLPMTHVIAAAGALAAIPLTWRWKLQTGAGLDLTPSMHWPEPIATSNVEPDQGPVLVTVEYRIGAEKRDRFLTTIRRLGHERERDGAYAWGVFEDTAQPGRFVEIFLVESWLEHLRQHDRVTNADRALEESVLRLQAEGMPKVTHLVATEPRERD